MEKISNIVRGNSRVASVDMKNSSPVRPGVPTFGRNVGESPHLNDKTETTAMRATAIQNELNEAKKSSSQDHAMAQMSNEFFMSRVRNPAEEIVVPPVATKGKVVAKDVDSDLGDEGISIDPQQGEINQPSGFKPRGSFVDVRV